MDYDKPILPPSTTPRAATIQRLCKHGWIILQSMCPRTVYRALSIWGVEPAALPRALSLHFDADIVGIDPSEKMLEQARGENLPGARSASNVGLGETCPWKIIRPTW